MGVSCGAEHHVGVLGPDLYADECVERFGVCGSVRMVGGEAFDRVLERMKSGCGDLPTWRRPPPSIFRYLRASLIGAAGP